MDWSTLTLVEGRELLAGPCFEIVAFSYAPPSEVGVGLQRVLHSFVEQFRGRFTYYRTGDMKRCRPFEDRSLEGPFHWFADTKILATKMLGFEVHSGDSDREVAPPSIDFSLLGFDKPPCFVVRMTLPVEAGSAPDRVISFVQDALADFPLASGHAGYSFYWDRTDQPRSSAVPKWQASLLRRHPGLGYDGAIGLSNAADRGVVAVSWLTFLGSAICADLGGLARLRRAAPAALEVLPLGAGGALIQAGVEPQLGDVNRQDLLPAYRAAARLVSPRRTPDDAFEDVGVDGMSEEQADEWLRRFFD